MDASQTLLSIIEFEILLKSAVYLETEIKKFDHEYAKIWNKLPKNRRDELLKAANERCAGHVDLPETDDALIDRLLSDLQIMFQKGRYLYEFNDHRSDEDAHNVGNNWIAGGARIEDADIRFRPMELFALSFALRQFCESKLEVASNTEPNLSSQSPTVKPLRNDG